MSSKRFAAAALALGVLLGAPAEARAARTYMWGVGPRLGTIVLPGHYPTGFPPAVKDNTSIEKVRGDVILGVDGEYWADGNNRFGALAGIGTGGNYLDTHLILKYDRITEMDAIDYFLGGGVGVGWSRWTGEGEEALRVPNYPFRGEAGLMMRYKRSAWQGVAFAQYNLQGNHYLTDAAGNELDVGTGFYLQIGVEVQAIFGDLTPPSTKKKKKRKKS